MRRVFACLLVLLLLPLAEIRSEAAVTFLDLSPDYRAYEEITYLAEGKITTGDKDGKFYTDREVTRAEAAAMLGRALNLNGAKRATEFSDVPMQSFASGYIQSAADKGIITGLNDGTFRPNQPIRRAEMAILINRAFGYNGQNSVLMSANELMVKGIARGITPTDFGFDLNIKRADFAVFLARAINYKLRVSPDNSSDVPPAITFDGEKYVIAYDILNVRTGPSTNYQKIGELIPGTKVETSYQVGIWTYIKAENIEGFVHQDFLADTYTPGQVPLNSISSQLVVIDPGHGGSDPGSVGFGLYESTVTLDTALRLKSILEKTPIQFKLTRSSNVFIPLSERVQIAKAANGNAFISIHGNKHSSTSASGTETYYYNSAAVNPYWEDSRRLATFIQNRMVEAWNLTDRGVKHGDFHVLRENTMPAVLVELGFISNPDDNAKLKSSAWRQIAAEAIYFGTLDYYKSKGFKVSHLYDYKNIAPEN